MNLKQIALALEKYEIDHKRFPPAVVTDKQGKPLYSWRVLILPYVDEKKLYDQFDKNAAWDSPQNIGLARNNISAFRCPNDTESPPGSTSYVAPQFDGGIITGHEGVLHSSITDGTSKTIIVVESRQTVPWSAPETLTLDDYVGELKHGDPLLHNGGQNVVCADGKVQFLSAKIEEKVLRALFTRAGPSTEPDWDDD